MKNFETPDVWYVIRFLIRHKPYLFIIKKYIEIFIFQLLFCEMHQCFCRLTILKLTVNPFFAAFNTFSGDCGKTRNFIKHFLLN